MKTNVKILDPRLGNEFPLPSYATEGSAGLDLRAMLQEPLVLNPGDVQLVPTGLAVQLPFNHLVGKVYARSGLSIKNSIALANGTGIIDADYTGEIKLALHNFSSEPYTVQPGDRVAQMVVTHISQIELVVVDDLEVTERGEGGFGSTGK